MSNYVSVISRRLDRKEDYIELSLEDLCLCILKERDGSVYVSLNFSKDGNSKFVMPLDTNTAVPIDVLEETVDSCDGIFTAFLRDVWSANQKRIQEYFENTAFTYEPGISVDEKLLYAIYHRHTNMLSSGAGKNPAESMKSSISENRRLIDYINEKYAGFESIDVLSDVMHLARPKFRKEIFRDIDLVSGKAFTWEVISRYSCSSQRYFDRASELLEKRSPELAKKLSEAADCYRQIAGLAEWESNRLKNIMNNIYRICPLTGRFMPEIYEIADKLVTEE